MQATAPSTVLTENADHELCPTCGHLISGHDAIGRRWCAATAMGVGGRSCMCTEKTFAASRTPAHY